jgi:hypothetical protein
MRALACCHGEVRETGIRIALGAPPASVLRLILGEGLELAGWGVAVGLVATTALAGTLRSLLFEVSPMDPLVLASTCAAVLGLRCAPDGSGRVGCCTSTRPPRSDQSSGTRALALLQEVR